MKHNWEIVDVGEYDYIHQCTLCKRRVMVSIDNPSSKAPEEGCVPSPKQIGVEVKRLEGEIAKFKGEISSLRSLCTHANATKKHGANTGNWCRQDDCYWTDFDCPDCGKHWTEDGSK